MRLNNNKGICTQCPNHCPITDPGCPKGRMTLAGENSHSEEKQHGKGGRQLGHHGRHPMNPDQESLEGLMGACGHHLHHRGHRGGGQEGILTLLAEKESMNQKELQHILQIQPGSVSEILTKLEHKGMIVREKNEDDRRKSVIRLTEMGKKALEGQPDRKKEEDMFAVLSEEEQAELKRLLKKLLDSWNG